MIKACDTKAKEIMKGLKDKAIPFEGLQSVTECPEIKFRCLHYPDLKILNPIVQGAKIDLSKIQISWR